MNLFKLFSFLENRHFEIKQTVTMLDFNDFPDCARTPPIREIITKRLIPRLHQGVNILHNTKRRKNIKYLLRLKHNIFQRFYVKNIAPCLKLTAGNVAAFPGAAVTVHQLRENNQTYKVAIWYPHTLQTNIFNLLSERKTIEGFKRIKFTLMTLCILDIVGKLLLFCKT